MTTKVERLGGRKLDLKSLERLRKSLAVPPELAKIMTSTPLIGLRFSLSDEVDSSGMGAEIQWMTPKQMLSEGTETYPGILATKIGYFPIGICLEGTGDPYFYRNRDGAVVRIPHDAATKSKLNEDSVETVAKSVAQLIRVLGSQRSKDRNPASQSPAA